MEYVGSKSLMLVRVVLAIFIIRLVLEIIVGDVRPIVEVLEGFAGITISRVALVIEDVVTLEIFCIPGGIVIIFVVLAEFERNM